ncbi:hypothetical protein SADFL11_00046320 [Roseibium alexandrii DFL-11]|uniref:N-acetyltransferase domain-containing protein n=1 Tax=Roseibium alexandrii (strain DSM 17067 / NCIMB 14079 / DFL-11) TaxID=244592 RepID=A0A5E8UXI2_ROSAD|nr:hypothetical protein SADFL11_00046320 [Roseibium alexandrii DFL-11]
MATLDTYRLREAWGISKRLLDENGFLLRRGVDFEFLEKRISVSEKSSLTEHFSTEKNTYTPSQAFWILVETPGGELVARAAARLDRLAGMSLEEYWRRYWRRCYPGVHEGEAEMADEQPCFASRIRGNVAYVGDLFVEKPYRNAGLAGALVRILQIDALDEWRPDYLYGWMTPEHVASQLFPDYGFRQSHPNGIIWKNPPSTIGGNLTCVGNSFENLLDLLLQITTSRRA